MNPAPRITIRPELPEDGWAVRKVLNAAFGGPAEAELVESLRASGELVLALVAVDGAAVVGYVAWPRLWVETPRDVRAAIGLAPLGVDPAYQRRGIGDALTRAGIAQLQDGGERLAFVLGDSNYYRRFEFSLEAARAFDSSYAGEHFMALKLAADAPERGRVRYPAAFDGLA
jgi:putative acetyltransferase